MYYKLCVLLFCSIHLYGYHPPYGDFEKNVEFSNAILYSNAEIILSYEDFIIRNIYVSNKTEENIYIFWNNFVFLNLLNKDTELNKKKQLLSNEIILYETENEFLITEKNYVDSSMNNYPLLIKAPKQTMRKVKERFINYSIPLHIKGLKKMINLEKGIEYMYKIKLKYIIESDIKKINDELGIDFTKNIISPVCTKISNGKPIEKSFEYIECFETDELNLESKNVQTILNKYIKEIETIEKILVSKEDPDLIRN